jgi:hypothetical protein
MAGSITVTTSDYGAGITKVEILWVSDASGDVSGSTFSMHPGTIIAVEFIPDSGGTQPSNLYDVTFLDVHGVNMFDAGDGTSIGANLSNTAASHHVPFVGGGSVTYVRQWLHGGAGYQPVVANAGNAKGGTIHIYQSRGLI